MVKHFPAFGGQKQFKHRQTISWAVALSMPRCHRFNRDGQRVKNTGAVLAIPISCGGVTICPRHFRQILGCPTVGWSNMARLKGNHVLVGSRIFSAAPALS